MRMKPGVPSLWSVRLVSGGVVLVFLTLLVLFHGKDDSQSGTNGLLARRDDLEHLHGKGIHSLRLRRRNLFHKWDGIDSEWIKKSPLGLFLIVFYDKGCEGSDDTVNKALEDLSKGTYASPMVFLSVNQLDYVDTFNDVFGDSFENEIWPAAAILNVHAGFKKYVLPLRTDNRKIPKYEPRHSQSSDENGGAAENPGVGHAFRTEEACKFIRSLNATSFQDVLLNELLLPYENGTGQIYLKSEREEYVAMNNHGMEAHGISGIYNHHESETIVDEGEIDGVTARQFQESILKGQGSYDDFFVVFYAPWCGHCRVLLQKIQALNEELILSNPRLIREVAGEQRPRQRAKIGFYKIDATKNDVEHPDINIKRVPTIFFFTRADHYKHAVPFSHRIQDYTPDSFRLFLSEHSPIWARALEPPPGEL